MWLLVLVAPVVLVVGYFLFTTARRRKGQAKMLAISAVPSLNRLERASGLGGIDPGDFPMSRAQRRRRSAAIAAYVGYNGSGKSATMVWDTLPDLAAGRKVLSTVALLSPGEAESPEDAEAAWEATGVPNMRPTNDLALPHPLWIPFTDFRQMLDFTEGVILMDEVQGIADARDAMGLPVQVRNKLFQLRRDDVVLRWSTIDWSAADKRIRNATQVLTYCRGFAAKYEKGRVWATRRIYWLRTYDAIQFDDFTEARSRTNEKNKPRPMVREWVRLFGALKPAITTYDSGAPVLALGASTEAGLCMTCGGRRRAKQCSCADHSKAGAGPARTRSEHGASHGLGAGGGESGATESDDTDKTDAAGECSGHTPAETDAV